MEHSFLLSTNDTDVDFLLIFVLIWYFSVLKTCPTATHRAAHLDHNVFISISYYLTFSCVLVVQVFQLVPGESRGSITRATSGR